MADDDESCEVPKVNGTGCLLICVVTTEISPNCNHTCKECKNSAVIKIATESTGATCDDTPKSPESIGARERKPCDTEYGKHFVV